MTLRATIANSAHNITHPEHTATGARGFDAILRAIGCAATLPSEQDLPRA